MDRSPVHPSGRTGLLNLVVYLRIFKPLNRFLIGYICRDFVPSQTARAQAAGFLHRRRIRPPLPQQPPDNPDTYRGSPKKPSCILANSRFSVAPYCSKQCELSTYALEAVDVDKSGSVTLDDAIFIFQYSNLETFFCDLPRHRFFSRQSRGFALVSNAQKAIGGNADGLHVANSCGLRTIGYHLRE